MHPELTRLEALEELERLLAATEERPLLLFKHSYTCGVSAEALDELVAHLNDRPTDVQYAMVTVQTHRDVSNAVAKKLGVRHETPQALLIRNGRVVWSASHFRVTATAVGEAIKGSARATAPRPTPTTTPTGN
jgi:bacillithiol system protein YtxJ